MIEADIGDEAGPRTRWTRADWAWIAAIGGIALTIRLGFASQYAGHPLGRLPWVDEGAYWSRAGEILRGRWLPSRPFYQDPLFPYALACLMKVLGPSVATLRVALACLGSATPVLIFAAGRRGLGRAEGVVAGLIAAFYGPLIFADGLLEKEGFAAMVASMALLASAGISSGSNGRAIGRAALSGWSWGLLALLRGNALLIGPIGATWAIAIGRGRRWAIGSTFAGGFLAAILPVAAINAHVGNPSEFIPTTWQSGANFYVGNGPGATGTYWAPEFVEANPAREGDDFEAEARRRSGRPLSPGEVSRFWFAEGLAHWREAPGESVGLLGKKLGLLLHDFEIPDNQDIAFVRIVAAPRLAWGFLSFGWIVPFAAMGLARRDRSPFWWLLATSTVAGLGSTAAFFVVARYRLPWTPGVALLAGAGVVDVAGRIRHREWRSLALRIAFLAIPAAVLAWRAMADPVPDRWGHAEIALAVAELGESRLDEAIDALDDARAFGVGSAARVAELAAVGPIHDRLVALIRGRIADGARRGGVTVLGRARWLRQIPEGRAEAIRLLDRLVAERPDDRAATRERGAWLLGETGDPGARDRAAIEFSRAAEGTGGDPSAAILLAFLAKNPGILPGFGGREDARAALARAALGGRAREFHKSENFR